MEDKEKVENVEKDDSIEKKDVVKKKIDIHPIWMYIVVCFLASFIAGFFGMAATFTQISNGSSENTNITVEEIVNNEEYNAIYVENISKAAAISQCCLFAILVIVLVATHMKRIKSDFKKWNKKQLLFVLISTVVLLALNFLMSAIFSHLNVAMNNQDGLGSMMNVAFIFTAIYMIVLAPIAEEMLFRYSLSTFIKNKYVFLIVSSLLFAIIHGIGVVTIVYFVIGFILSFIYVKTEKNITAPILAHMINNLVSVVTMLIG